MVGAKKMHIRYLIESKFPKIVWADNIRDFLIRTNFLSKALTGASFLNFLDNVT